MEQELQKIFLQREEKIISAKNFLDSHTDKDGKLSAKDAEYADEMVKEVEHLTSLICDKLNAPINKPILNNPQNSLFGAIETTHKRKGVNAENYRRDFFAQLRNGFRDARNVLIESEMDRGGYLVPSEWHDELISELRNENVLRQISRVVETQNDRKICIVASSPTADFIQEGQEISLTSESFTQKTLSAYKLACAASVSNELISDSYYNIEDHLAQEFGKAIGSKEEDSLLNVTGVNEPYGLLSIISDNATTMTTLTVGANIAADDLLNLVYKLPRPYRKNAAFLMNDATLAAVRKLKDADLHYIWQPSLTESEPDRLLGYPVYSSQYMPNISSGAIPIIFGSFDKFIIGQRGEFSFRQLYELHALRDLSTFIATERFDGLLSDNHAMRGLQINS